MSFAATMDPTPLPDQTRSEGDEENPLVKRLAKWCRTRRKHWKERFDELRKGRGYLRGEVGEGRENEDLVRANLIHSTIQTLMPLVYARNPEVSVSPSESVTPGQYAAIKKFARTMEIVLNRGFKDARLKDAMKQAVRSAFGSRLGWVKVTYQRDWGKDPHIMQRIEDAQDNIARIDALVSDLEEQEETGNVDGINAMRQRLQHLLDGLQQQVEVVVAEGLCIDFLAPEHVILDTNIRSLYETTRCRRIAHEFFLSVEEAKEQYPEVESWEQAKRFTMGENGSILEGDAEAPENATTGRSGESEDDRLEKVLRFYEVWDKTTNTVYTICEGMKQFAREPWQPERQGERWFPFFWVGFHLVDGYVQPLSLVDLLKELQDEYNETRTQLAEHRRISIPHWLADAAENVESLRRYSDAQMGEVVLIDANGRPLREVIDVANPPPFNPAVYDTTPVRVDVEMVSNVQNAQRGSVPTAKTATEAEILASGAAERSSEMTDAIEDTVEEIAKFVAEVFLQELTIMQVARMAGPDAVWPRMGKEDVFDLVQIEVRSGTSGKPDKARERQQWIELLPLVEKLLVAIMESMAPPTVDPVTGASTGGGDPTPWVMLLRETFRRFDERLDVEEFLPMLSPGLQGPMAALMQGGAMGGGNVVPMPGAQPAQAPPVNAGTPAPMGPAVAMQ